MNNLENYILSEFYDNKVYVNDINYSDLGYDEKDEMEDDLIFLKNTFYNNLEIIYENNKSLHDNRPMQQKFKENLINKYKKCVVTGGDCLDELEGAHIIPFCQDKNNNSISNGLLLKSTIHKTFDKYKWAINPSNLLIEVKKNVNAGEIEAYEGKKVELDKMNIILMKNITESYQEFLSKN